MCRNRITNPIRAFEVGPPLFDLLAPILTRTAATGHYVLRVSGKTDGVRLPEGDLFCLAR